MPDNPLELSPEHEHRIRERAYHLWENEGRPEGRELDYWERARELDAIASSQGAGLKPNPMTEHQGEIQPEQPIEEAEIMQNLGEFPDRNADQGESATAPIVKKKASRTKKTS